MELVKLKARAVRGSLASVMAFGAVLVAPSGPAAAALPDLGIALRAARNGLCVSVDLTGDVNNLFVVKLVACTTASLEGAFSFVPMGDGTYQIQNSRFSGDCLTIKNNQTTNNTPVVPGSCSAAKPNRFRFRPVPGKPTFRIVSESSKLCLNTPDGGNPPLVQYTCSASASALNDQFTFSPTASPTAVPQPVTRRQPVVAVQGSPSTSALAPLSYSYIDDLGSLKIGHQADPDSINSLQWTTPNGERYVGQPQMGVQADGRVEVMARNQADGDLELATQTAKGAATYGPLQDVGGALATQPAVGRAPTNGRLVIFTIIRGVLWYLPQDGKNVPYGAWRPVLGTSGLTGTPTVVALRDSLRIFVLNAAGELLTGTFQDDQLAGWTNLGGTGLNGTVSTVVYPGYWVRVFARGADGVLVNKAQKEDGSFPAEWSAVGDFVAAGSPSAVLDPVKGRTGVVARGADDQIHAVFETGQLTGAWGSWQTIESRPIVTNPTAFTWARSGGQTWGYVVRDDNSQPLLYTVNDIGGASLRATAGRLSPFTMHTLPAPPR